MSRLVLLLAAGLLCALATSSSARGVCDPFASFDMVRCNYDGNSDACDRVLLLPLITKACRSDLEARQRSFRAPSTLRQRASETDLKRIVLISMLVLAPLIGLVALRLRHFDSPEAHNPFRSDLWAIASQTISSPATTVLLAVMFLVGMLCLYFGVFAHVALVGMIIIIYAALFKIIGILDQQRTN